MAHIVVDGRSMSVRDVVSVARESKQAGLSPAAAERVRASRDVVERALSSGRTVYGVTTGFGKLSEVTIDTSQVEALQRNLILSHCAGVGDPLDIECVRAVMLLRANALAHGLSGVRLSTLDTLLRMLNAGVHPVIPEKGSLGASGDLAPLAHMCSVMIGEGEAFYRGRRLKGGEAMKEAGIEPVVLKAKEGLALINGTQVMSAIGCLAAHDAAVLATTADVAASLTLEALRGIPDAFGEGVIEARPHAGARESAANVRRLVAGSMLTSRPGEVRVQDAYALRCIPQVHGACRDAIRHAAAALEIEINSATDNPLIFSDSIVSGGNFHGEPVALPLDYLGIGLSELANISERRIERLVNPALSGLPAFLAVNGGLNSGFMLMQYTAAALVSENKILASPASVDSIPSSANQEDHVSMGTIAARKAREIAWNTSSVIAMELLTAAQAVDFRDPDMLGDGTRAAYDLVRSLVSRIEVDRPLAPD
ncbi:MAG: histidine ammonia-lyase, partial [Bacillota bacterium]